MAKNRLHIKGYLLALGMMIFSCFSINAQDIHFSQFTTTPLVVNPAHTGNFVGNFRLSNNYRSQWTSFGDGSGYQTLSIAYDQPLRMFKRNLSAGGAIIYDKSGPLGFTLSKFLLSMAYQKSRGKNHLHLGVQAGMVMRQFDESGALFGSQFNHNTGYLDPAITSGELDFAENYNSINLNVGGIWKRDFNRVRSEIGIALFGINYPKEKFTGSDDRTAAKSLFHGAFTYYATTRFHVKPQFVYQRVSGVENLLAGADFLLMTSHPSSAIEGFFVGGYVRSGFNRNTDAAIVTAGVKAFKFRIGVSYDLNISDLQEATQSMGGFEISVVYTGISTVFDPGALPCTRQ